MSYSRLRIFSPNGIWIDEIDVPTVRSWVLDGVGRCQFVVPTYRASTGGLNPKCTYANFQSGNLVLIEHKPSQNADGTFNGLLPPWVGVIMPPQDWEYGKVTVTAYSAEQVLDNLAVSLNYVDGPLAQVFKYYLNVANAVSSVPIQPGVTDNYNGGAYYTYPSGSVLDAVKTLYNNNGFDFDITPQVSASNQLTLIGNLYRRKGIATGQVLSNLSLQSESPMYSEQGKFYNTVIGWSDASTDGVRVKAIAQDLSYPGNGAVFSKNVIFSGTGGAAQDIIQTMANAYLAANRRPIRTFAPTLLDVGNLFSYVVTGNTFIVQNDTVGFQDGGIGINGIVRVTAIEYNDLTNAAKLAVQLL